MINKGAIYIHEFSFSQEEVNKFAEVTGDKNPVHLDEEYASKTMFKRPIIHGMLGASMFSKVFGTLFPGEGTIYIKQSINFLKPMYVDMIYLAEFTVKEAMPQRNMAVVETVIKDKTSSTICTNGEALIMNKDKIN